MKRIQVAQDLTFSQVVSGFMRVLDSGKTGRETLDFVENCLDMGVTTFDHADIYGNYGCELFFGENVLKKRPELRRRMEVVTKADIVLPGTRGNEILYYDTTRDHLIKRAERSLANLGTDYLDMFLLHRPDPLMDPGEAGAALDELIDTGKIRYAGVSNFNPMQTAALQKHMKHRLVVNQVQLSVCAPEVLFDGTMDEAHMERRAVMAWSPLAGGRIGGENGRPELWRELDCIARQRGTGVEQIMLAWVLRCPGPVCAVSGSFRPERIRQAAEACRLELSRLEWFRLLQASRGFPVP
ncbi:aldo/keto reductase [Allofournierella sp.]|uniref:aldo/keto reductase n=1 Tax=Allofournierella sp. TaxID=1940256 RepID=UPI003AB5BD1D